MSKKDKIDKQKQMDIEFLQDWWDGAVDLEIGRDKEGKTLIFELLGHYDHKNKKWCSDKERRLIKPDLRYYPKYKKFTNKLKRKGLINKLFTINEVVKLVEELL